MQTPYIILDAQGVFLLKNIPNHKIAVILKKKKIWLVSNFEPNQTYTVSFQYETSPKKALYFLDQQIWTQGQGKYTSNWLPSIDDMNDKIEFDISYIIPSDKTIVANGKLVAVTDHGDAKKWSFDIGCSISKLHFFGPINQPKLIFEHLYYSYKTCFLAM